MRSRTLLLCVCIVAGALVAIVHSTAQAAERVLTMDRHGRVHRHVDRALPPLDEATLAPAAAVAASAPSAAVASKPRSRERTVRGELRRLLARRQIDAATAARDRGAFDDAIRTARRLRGTRRAELQAVIATLHDIAARGQLTAARLPVVLGAVLMAAFALLHGHAHGAELPSGAAAATYAAGFAIATAALHVLGLGIAHLCRTDGGKLIVRGAGAAVAVAGVALAVI